MAVVLALSSAVVYGASDFLGGLASRRASVFGVVALSQLAGLVALLALLPWLGGPVVGAPTWAGARRRGSPGAAGLVVFFRALARGVMSVIAPVTAVTAAAVPVLAGLLGGNRIGPVAGRRASLLALVAVVLVSAEGGLGAAARRPPGQPRPRRWSPAPRSGASSSCSTARPPTRASRRWSRPGSRRSCWSVAVALVGRRPLRVGRGALPLVAGVRASAT